MPTEKIVRTGFRPVDHGFLFNNDFEITIEILGVPPTKWGLGFCGGMSLAAVKAFCSREKLTRSTSTPVEGEELFTELMQQQIETLKKDPKTIPTIYAWQCYDDLGSSGCGARTKRGWPRIQSCLDAKRPVVLMVIREEGYFANIFNNHQVVGIGYEIEGNIRRIQIYDPNYPKEVGYLKAEWGLKNNRIRGRQFPLRPNQRVRGFYLNVDVKPCFRYNYVPLDLILDP